MRFDFNKVENKHYRGAAALGASDRFPAERPGASTHWVLVSKVKKSSRVRSSATRTRSRVNPPAFPGWAWPDLAMIDSRGKLSAR